jgi:hypothetical protein
MKENEFIISLKDDEKVIQDWNESGEVIYRVVKNMNKDDISSNVMRKLNIDIWINREDVCIGCHNEDCGGCGYVKYFKE